MNSGVLCGRAHNVSTFGAASSAADRSRGRIIELVQCLSVVVVFDDRSHQRLHSGIVAVLQVLETSERPAETSGDVVGISLDVGTVCPRHVQSVGGVSVVWRGGRRTSSSWASVTLPVPPPAVASVYRRLPWLRSSRCTLARGRPLTAVPRQRSTVAWVVPVARVVRWAGAVTGDRQERLASGRQSGGTTAATKWARKDGGQTRRGPRPGYSSVRSWRRHGYNTAGRRRDDWSLGVASWQPTSTTTTYSTT